MIWQIYNSRTFCLYEEIDNIKRMGLAKGGSLDNAVVVQGGEILNQDGLRNIKEFVYHKILDCLGDIMLSGNRFLVISKLPKEDTLWPINYWWNFFQIKTIGAWRTSIILKNKIKILIKTISCWCLISYKFTIPF